jgi:hypothetical protein
MFEDAITKAGPAVPPYAANDFLRELELALGEYGYWVASFSYADNDLSQWRSYVDNGKGVCLGFSPQAFDLSILFDNLAGAVSVHHARVEYDEPTLRELIREYIDETIKLLTRVNSGLPPRLRNQRRAVVYMRSVLRTLMMALYVPAMVSKHPAYQHEQESRLIVNGSRSIIEAMSCHKVRARNGEIISYVDMPIPNWKASNVLTHVRIGPAAQPKLAEQMASAFRSLGLPLPQIEPSGLPFRTTR